MKREAAPRQRPQASKACDRRGFALSVGDEVTFSEGGGRLVAVFASEEFAEDFPRSRWAAYRSGVVVEASDGQLFHFSAPEMELTRNAPVQDRAARR